MPTLCIQCGAWKQVPLSRCTCEFKPATGSTDAAKSFLLTIQFRSEGELDEAARRIRAGLPVEFGEEELKLGRTIGWWNAVVTLAFLAFAISLGLLLGCAAAGLSWMALTLIAAATLAAAVSAFALMAYVDGRVARVLNRKRP